MVSRANTRNRHHSAPVIEDIITERRTESNPTRTYRLVRRDYSNMTDWINDAEYRDVDRAEWLTAPTWVDPSGKTKEERRRSRVVGRTRNEWAGCSWREAVKYARDGWPEGRRIIEERSEHFKEAFGTTMILQQRPAIVHDIAGSMPDVGRFLAGVPDNMMTWSRIESHAPAIRIVINQAASSGISSEQIMNRGAVVCALIDLLESSGKRCEIVAVAAVADDWSAYRHKLEIAVMLKQADEPLQIDKVAFMLAHPAALRRIGFALMETLPEDFRHTIGITPTGDYGTPVNSDDEADIYIPASYYGQYSLEWLREQLTKAGVLEGES